MTHAPCQPNKTDAVLGGLQPPPISAAVLGGLEGVRYRFNSPVEAHKILALKDALNYGEAGIGIAMVALDCEFKQVKKAAYSLLFSNEDTKAKLVLPKYNFYYFFEHLDSVEVPCILGNFVPVILSYTIAAFTFSDNRIGLLNFLPSGSCLRFLSLSYTGKIYSATISLDGKIIIGVTGQNQESIAVWNLEVSSNPHVFSTHSGKIVSVVIAPDNKTFATVSKNKILKVWSLDTYTCLRSFPLYSNVGWRVIAAINSKVVAACDNNCRSVKIWNVESGELLTHNFSDEITSIDISLDSQILVVGFSNGSIYVWNISSTELVCIFCADLYKSVTAVKILPDSKVVVSGNSVGNINVWHIDTKKCLKVLTGHSSVNDIRQIDSIVLSENGTKIITSGSNNVVKIWGIPEIL